MKSTTLIIVALWGFLLCSASTVAHPTDTAATYVTSVNWTAPILSTTDVDAGYILTFWLTSQGNYECVIDVNSITFSGTTCGQINSVPLYAIIEDIADHAAQQAVLAGYPGCALTQFQKPTKVWANNCALRSSSGCSTEFTVCSGTEWCYRSYTVSCPGTGAAATITQGASNGTSCSGSCEPAWDDSGLE